MSKEEFHIRQTPDGEFIFHGKRFAKLSSEDLTLIKQNLRDMFCDEPLPNKRDRVILHGIEAVKKGTAEIYLKTHIKYYESIEKIRKI